MKKIDRLQFLQLAGGILGAGVATAVTACGGDDTAPAGGAASCNPSAPSVTIGSNHGHTMTVTAAQITAAVAMPYQIMGGAPHDHTVDLSAANFHDLAAGKSVATSSGTGGADGHTHSIVIC